MHVKGNGGEGCTPRHCGGWVTENVCLQPPGTVNVADSTKPSGTICACGGTGADHRLGDMADARPPPPPLQSTLASTSLHPIPGPSRPIVDSSPITRSFAPPQQSGNTSNERRVNSANRATIRNAGGIPSPVSTPTRRTGRGSSNPMQRKASQRLTVLLLPLYASNLTGSSPV